VLLGRAAPVRREVCDGLEYLGIQLDPGRNDAHADPVSAAGSPCAVRVIVTNEDLMIARHTIFPRLGVPEGEGWVLATFVALGYPTGRWGVPPRKPAHDVTFVERWGQRPSWTVPGPLWP
jgi:Acetokinase family